MPIEELSIPAASFMKMSARLEAMDIRAAFSVLFMLPPRVERKFEMLMSEAWLDAEYRPGKMVTGDQVVPDGATRARSHEALGYDMKAAEKNTGGGSPHGSNE